MKDLFAKHSLIVLIIIIFVGFFIRIYHVSSIPGSLNIDEAALGYNAFSILKTGADEHGKFLPLALQSFGDWKLPVYSYIDTLPIAVLGLTEFSTRLPSVVFGTLGIFFIYGIGVFLFKRKEIGLFAALFFALSPWSIYFSRAAYEVNVATTFFLAGVWMFLEYVESKQKKSWQILLAAILFGIPSFTYNSYEVFTPLFVLCLIICFRKQFKKSHIEYLALVIALAFFIGAFVNSYVSGANKVSTLLILNDKNVIYNRAEKLRGDTAPKNAVLEKMLYTKYSAVAYQFAENYVNSFSPVFLFDQGGEKLVHNLGDFGNLYLFDALLLTVGVGLLFCNREKALFVLIPWLLLAPIPTSLTTDTPNSTRLFPIMPLFILVSAYSAYWIVKLLRRYDPTKYGAIAVISILFLINVAYFMDVYFVHFNYQRVRFWKYGYKQAVEVTQHYPQDNVVVRGPENFPYIYFAFYTAYDPAKFQKGATYYPPTNEGFYYVKSFGKYSFVNSIDYGNLKPHTVYIDDTNPQNSKNAIHLPSGEPILGYTVKN